MHRPIVLPLLLLPLALCAQVAAPPPPAPAAPASPPTDNCGPIRQQIEARFRAGGVQPSLAVVEAGLHAGGRVVGTCGSGRRQIVLLGQAPATPGAAAPTGALGERGAERAADKVPERSADRPSDRPTDRPSEREPVDRIPTECKDGSIVIGPNCDDPRAVRMTSAEVAASLAPARPASAEATPTKPASR